MNVISLKEYAKQHNISYEAVRKQVSRFKNELGTHIIQDGRQQFLDEEAVAFLDARREKNPISIIQQDKDDTIKALEDENKGLLQKIALLQDELLKEKDKRLELSDKIAKVELLEESKAKAELALEDVREDLKTAEDIAEAAGQEAERAKEKAADLEAALEQEKNRSITFKEWWRRRK